MDSYYTSSYASVSCSVRSFATLPPFPLSSHTTQHYIVLSRCRCKYQDSPSSQTTQSYPGSSVKSMIQHPSCYRKAGADLKTQRQVTPQKLFSASFNIHTPTIHHAIETQVQISKFKRQVRPCIYHSLWYQDAGADLKIQMSSQTISSYVHTKLSSGNESSNQHSHS